MVMVKKGCRLHMLLYPGLHKFTQGLKLFTALYGIYDEL